MTGEKIINFKLDAQTIEKLTKQKSLHVEYKKTGVFVSEISNEYLVAMTTVLKKKKTKFNIRNLY